MQGWKKTKWRKRTAAEEDRLNARNVLSKETGTLNDDQYWSVKKDKNIEEHGVLAGGKVWRPDHVHGGRASWSGPPRGGGGERAGVPPGSAKSAGDKKPGRVKSTELMVGGIKKPAETKRGVGSVPVQGENAAPQRESWYDREKVYGDMKREKEKSRTELTDEQYWAIGGARRD